jgi:hypothetical protein
VKTGAKPRVKKPKMKSARSAEEIDGLEAEVGEVTVGG